MAKELMDACPEFRNDIKAMDKVLAGLPGPPLWTVKNTSKNSSTCT